MTKTIRNTKTLSVAANSKTKRKTINIAQTTLRINNAISSGAGFDFHFQFNEKKVPFVFLNDRALNVKTRKILGKLFRKYATAWISLARR